MGRSQRQARRVVARLNFSTVRCSFSLQPVFSPEKKTRVKDRDFNAEKNREIKVVCKVVPPSSSVNSKSSTLSINSFPFPSSSSSHRFNAGSILLLLLKLTQIGLSSTSLPKLGWSGREDRGLSGLASEEERELERRFYSLESLSMIQKSLRKQTKSRPRVSTERRRWRSTTKRKEGRKSWKLTSNAEDLRPQPLLPSLIFSAPFMGKPVHSMSSSRTQAIQEINRLTILKENIEAEMVSSTFPSLLPALVTLPRRELRRSSFSFDSGLGI